VLRVVEDEGTGPVNWNSTGIGDGIWRVASVEAECLWLHDW